ncbi:hypothetical protein ACX0MV_06880 [Pseudomonas borbori]
MNKSISPTPARIVLSLLAFSFLGFWGLINHSSYKKLNELIEYGVSAPAKITSKQCSNHGELLYTFTVNGKAFGGSGTCITPCENAKFGDPIEITYSPSSPHNSQCTAPEEKAERITTNYLLLLALFVATLIIIFRVTSIDAEQRL